MNKKIHTLYFSATGATEKIVTAVAQAIATRYNGPVTVHHIDITLPKARIQKYFFDRNDLVIAGVPVYAGRVPNVLLKFLNTIAGNGATAVAVVLYGNRDYDDALIEFRDILAADGFTVIAGGAFIGEHSFSSTLGAHRPDGQDMSAAADFAARIYDKTQTPGEHPSVAVKGHTPYRPYYRPRDQHGNFMNILKVTPKTSGDCIDCKLCSEVCPMGSVDFEVVASITGICIKCCACLKRCPVGAKYFDDANYLWHARELEVKFTDTRREPECFV